MERLILRELELIKNSNMTYSKSLLKTLLVLGGLSK